MTVSQKFRIMFFRILYPKLTSFASILGCTHSIATDEANRTLLATDFEVFGHVQGVYFRVYTKEQADRLGIRGWCKNTPNGTVQGHMQGPSDRVETMMYWLKSTGSPSSKIEKAEFRNQKDIGEFTFDNFGILRD